MKIIQLVLLSLTIFATAVSAKEDIFVVNAQGPTQSMTPQILRVIDEANKIQNKYNFVLSFKTGGFESIGVKEMLEKPNNHIVTITNSFNESIDRGFVNVNDIVPVFSHGDACWAVITNFGNTKKGLDSIKDLDVREITVGTPAPGGSAHLSALIIGDKYEIPVRLALFRGAYDALLNMAANNGVTFAVDRVANYKGLSVKNPRLAMLGINCPQRLAEYPELATLKEQGIVVPYIWHFTMASKKMPESKRKEIAEIFAAVYKKVGQKEMQSLSDFIAPIYTGQSTEDHWKASINGLRDARKKYADQIKKDQ
jgi:tripartite-type tricarboxylate transporter receptor subunit TctC